MKYIFDFDDVLFNNTAQFKEHMFRLIALAGVPEKEARDYYSLPEIRGKEFSLRKFLKELFSRHPEITERPETVYQNIMSKCSEFKNTALVEAVQRLGKDNCYIVSNGEQEFNRDKIKYSGIGDFFLDTHIFIVPKGKADTIKRICDSEENKGQVFVFIDDRKDFLAEINPQDFPNVTTIEYDRTGQQGLAKLLRTETTTNSGSVSELKRIR